MAAGTLYTYPDNCRAQNILIAAKYSGAKVEVAANFKYGETNKSDDFLAKFPLGKVPAFEGSDGTTLFGSNAIAYHVANEALRGASAADAAQVQQWIGFADNEITPASNTWVYPCLGMMQYNKQNTERAKEELKRALGALNSHLRTRTFLVGERVSLADITVCCSLLNLYKLVLDADFRKPYQNTNRWFTTVINQPNVKAVVGELKLCEKMAQFDAKKFQELQGGGKGGKKEGKKEKPAQQPKKEKPKEVKKEPEPEEEKPKEEKVKDPFALMPKGTFVIDDWKKTYSNKETSEAMDYFWKNFDPENYSVWHCEYKYPDELKLIFMTCNLVSGMFQRLDRLRKYGFASVLIFGKDNDNSISGVWLWRGHDLAFELSEDLSIDYESYNWRKLDYNSEETKKMITEYFTWEGDFGGREVNQGKIFK